MKVVIADDEARERRLIEILLNRIDAGVPIEIAGTADNGKNALKLVCAEDPDVLITDIRMPGLTGLELIRALREAKKDLNIIVISGYDMFSYAQEAIQFDVEDYLLKPLHQGELENALRKIAAKLERVSLQQEVFNELKKSKQLRFLRKLSAGECLSPDGGQLTRELLKENYACDFDRRYYYVAVLKTDVPEIADNQTYEEQFKRKISHVIAKTLIDYYGKLIYLNEGDVIWFLILSDDDIFGQLKKSFQNLIFELRLPDVFLGNLHATVAISNAESEIDALPRVAERTKKTVADRIYMGTDKVLEANEQDVAPRIEDYISGAFRRRLTNALETEQIAEIETCIDQLKDQILSDENRNGAFLYDVTEELFDILFYALRSLLSGEDLQNRHTAFKRSAAQCRTPEELFETVQAVYRKMVQHVRDERVRKAVRPIEEAKRYIARHYAQNISQSEVGAAVGLSTAYLSSLFKKEEGISFSDYLTQTRIYAACDRLVASNESIDRIAEAVGYNDPRYFTKSFKKVMKLSPGEYRKLYTK